MVVAQSGVGCDQARSSAHRRQPSCRPCGPHLAGSRGSRRSEPGDLAPDRRRNRRSTRRVCALRWADVDLNGATVRIERSVSATKTTGIIIKSTKTGRVRLVGLTDDAVEALRSQLRRAHDVARSVGRRVEAEDLIFTNDSQARLPWRPELVIRRWERLRRKTGVGAVRIHDLRHFVATELLSAGIDVRTVANRLGHARTSTTLDIYWAWVPARDRDAARHLQTILRQSEGPRSDAGDGELLADSGWPCTRSVVPLRYS